MWWYRNIYMWEMDHKEGWMPKNWCFWTVVLNKTLESPLDFNEIKPVHLKEINPEYSLEGLMLKLKLQDFGYLMWRANSLEKILMLGKIEGRRRRGWQKMRMLGGITDSMDMSLNKVQEMVKDGEVWRVAVHGVAKSQIQLRDWTTTTWMFCHLERWKKSKCDDLERKGWVVWFWLQPGSDRWAHRRLSGISLCCPGPVSWSGNFKSH